MADSRRSRRLQDFRRRAAFAPESVYRHRCNGWLYMPVHPFADEAEPLSRLAISPENCWAVDAWWCIEEDTTLVQSCIARRAGRAPGLYARRTEHVRAGAVPVCCVGLPHWRRLPVA